MSSIKSWKVKYINIIANTVYTHNLDKPSNLIIVRNPSTAVRVLFGDDSGISSSRYQTFADVDGGGFFVRPEMIKTMYFLATQNITRITIEEYIIEDPIVFFTAQGKPANTDVNVTSTVGVKPGDLNIDSDKDLQVDVKTLVSALPAGTNNIGDVDVLTLPAVTIDKVTGISSITVSADNAAATITLAAPAAGVAHYVWGIIAGFVGGAATKLLTVKDGTTVKENIPVVNSMSTERAKPLKISDATALEVSLAASGTAGIIGYVTVMYETR